jgi:hypothetical protein
VWIERAGILRYWQFVAGIVSHRARRDRSSGLACGEKGRCGGSPLRTSISPDRGT